MRVATIGETRMDNKLKTNELDEAAQAFADSGFDADAMRPLMNLVENQSDWIQKRFWNLVDSKQS
jgi:hypothetical protein